AYLLKLKRKLEREKLENKSLQENSNKHMGFGPSKNRQKAMEQISEIDNIQQIVEM
ncbi:2191_t:CDS:1, partial [Gigaspora rosea]